MPADAAPRRGAAEGGGARGRLGAPAWLSAQCPSRFGAQCFAKSIDLKQLDEPKKEQLDELLTENMCDVKKNMTLK